MTVTKPLILQRFQTLQNSIRQQIITMLSQMLKEFIKISRSDILIYRNAYAIIAVGKRDCKSMGQKRVKPSVPQILGASSCLFIVDKKLLG